MLIGAHAYECGRVVAEDGVERVDAARGFERGPPAQHVVEEKPEAEDVAWRIDLATPRLLRRHVAHGVLSHAVVEKRVVLGIE